jgi:fructose-1,6-bisphosphatase/inositol monophosphatase family enzyme
MNYAQKVIPILRQAGDHLAKNYGKTAIFKQKKKLAASVLTKLDLSTEKYLKQQLEKEYPAIEFFGEEFGGKKQSGKFWLADPIDGTAHFVRGIPFCTTMLALIDDGQIIFCAIHDFVSNTTFHAQKNHGAKMNGRLVHVSNRGLKNAYLTYEINLNPRKNRELLVALTNQTMMFKTISCGFEFGLIAQGKIDGRISLDPFGDDWDYAPGALLIAEAGGVVRNIGKKDYDFTNHNFIAVNPTISKELKNKFGL